MPLLNDVSFSYTNKIENLILKNLKLIFLENNLYVINGKNGCGKSTLMDVIMGLYQKQILSGIITYNDVNIDTLDMYKIRKSIIGYIEQHADNSNKSVRDFLFFNVNEELDDKCSTEAEKVILHNCLDKCECIDMYINDNFNVLNMLNRDMNTLSGGQQQKIRILKELLLFPDVLILDEPTSALDQKSIIQLVNLINSLKHDRIIIIITHDDYFDKIMDIKIDLDTMSTSY